MTDTPDITPGTTVDNVVNNQSISPTSFPTAPEFLAGGGEMGERMRAVDWSKTSLGPVENWPQSLKTAVRIILTSRQPMFVWWGKELINLYNAPYKAIVGGKHPQALGQPASVVWKEIWEQVGPRAERVMQHNEGTYDEALLLIMERNGYPEETYYTFSYSPIPADEGGTGGIICANTDDTQRIIGERQLKLLRELAAGTADARTIQEACLQSALYLEHNPYDIPFALIYLFEQTEQAFYLSGVTGIDRNHPVVAEKLSLTDEHPWPLNEVLSKSQACIITDINSQFPDLPQGKWKRPSHQAVAVPIAGSGQTGKKGVLVVGLNPYRVFDESYSGFISLVSGQIAASIANAQAYEEERKRSDALAEIDRAKTTFFSNVSHELRTPLTLMLGPIEDMLMDTNNPLQPQQQDGLRTLHRNSLRLLKLVNTLLDFSRIESGRVRALYEPTDLSAYTTDLASSFRSAIEKAGMQLIVNCPPLASPVYIDRDMWEKIVLNLLSNAFKYTLKGSITITLQKAENEVELLVADTGTGIPEKELNHIFERFHRIEGAEGRTYEGTGIGLSLVQELVKLHSGSISVKSMVGEGSTFTVAIPLGNEHLPRERVSRQHTRISNTLGPNPFVEEALRWLPDNPVREITEMLQDLPMDFAKPLQTTHPLPSTPKAKILLADDNADMREYLSKLLMTRYEVKAVPNGEIALQETLRELPDLVLTDVMMPKLDGFGLLKQLRAIPSTNTIPIIMLSARAGEEAQVEGMEAGADDYLVKPFSARELMARVGAHLEMARIRKQANQKIREVQKHLSSVIDNAPIVLWALDKNGVYTLSEGKGLEMLGVKPGEMVGKSHFDFYQTAPELVEPVKRALNGESLTVSLEVLGQCFETYYTPLLDEKGEIDGIVAVSTDVTLRKKAQEERERILQQFEAVLEQMPAGVLIAQAPNGEIILSNKQVEHIWQQPSMATGDLLSNGQYQGFHADGTPYNTEEWPLYRALNYGEEVVGEEINMIRGDGNTGTIRVGAAPIRDANGEIFAAVAIFIDITDRKRLERQKDEFIAIASHELKTPVTSLKAYGQVLQTVFKRKGDVNAVTQLAKMDAQINKLTGLIRDLLDIPKIQADKLYFQEESFDFNELVSEIVEELQHTTEQHTIVKEFDPGIKVRGDRERTGQVLTNLISNAIKYSPSADRVIVRTYLEKGKLTFSVQDFGIGIAPDKQVQIFDRFYRAEGKNQETFPGLGLGLYISSEIIRRQKGEIWVESTEGKGSTFYFNLPIQPSDMELGQARDSVRVESDNNG